MNEIIVLTTADSADLAGTIASALVEAKEAACVSIIPGLRSIYRWEGKVCDDAEWLLVIKTSAARFEAVRSIVRQVHTYQTPEILAVPVAAGDPDYLRWLNEQVSG